MGKDFNKGAVKPKALGIDKVEIHDITCAMCKKRKKILQNGQFHCKYCGVMCEECASDHQKTPKEKGHWADKLKLISQYEPLERPTFNHIIKCEAHPKRHIKGYCLDHGQLVCKDCLKTQHQGCATEELETMSESVSRETHMVEARYELTDLRRRCKMAGTAKRNEIIHMSKQAQTFEDYVRKLREKINVLFDDMVTAIIRDKDAFCKSEGELIEKDVSKCAELGPVFESVGNNFEQAFRNGKQTEMWVALKKLEQVITYYDEIVTRIENDKSEVKFEFVPNKSLQGVLEAPETVGKMRVTSSRLYGNERDLLATQGETSPNKTSKFKSPFAKNVDEINPNPWVKSTRLESASTPLPAISKTSNSDGRQGLNGSPVGRKNHKGTIMTRTPNGLLTPKLPNKKGQHYDLVDNRKVHADAFGPSKEIQVTYIGRKEVMTPADGELTSITGSTFLPNGRLVLVDNHNKTLKLFSAEYEFLAGVVLEERPWNVTSCYKALVAVSFPYDKSVELITTGVEMKIEGKIMTDRTCHGMGFHNTEKWLYIACGEGKEAQIQAYSLEGHLRKVIIPKEGVLHEPRYLSMSADSSKLFVSDLDNGVIGFNTKSGDVICHYKDPKIKRYWDLKLDSDGRVFVLTTSPECLYVLMGDHNGRLIKEFRVGNKPCSLSYSSYNHDLVVTSWTVEDVEVFRFV